MLSSPLFRGTRLRPDECNRLASNYTGYVVLGRNAHYVLLGIRMPNGEGVLGVTSIAQYYSTICCFNKSGLQHMYLDTWIGGVLVLCAAAGGTTCPAMYEITWMSPPRGPAACYLAAAASLPAGRSDFHYLSRQLMHHCYLHEPESLLTDTTWARLVQSFAHGTSFITAKSGM